MKLSGTVSVTQNDVRAITTVDLRPELRVGDVVEVQTLQFVVVSPFTDKLFTLSDAFTGPSASGVFAYRVIAGSGPGLLMPGCVWWRAFVSASVSLCRRLRLCVG